MKKLLITLIALLSLNSSVFALTDAQIKTQVSDVMSGLVSGHNLAFGKDNLYKEALDLGMWNKAISNMKTLVTTLINDNTNFIGMRSSTLTSAFDKIVKAEMDLVNNIKITRGVLASPTNVQKQITILNKIKTDMLAVQKTLASSMTPLAKDEARKLLNNAAMFIETTAAKAARDALK
jgi:hypothetical protein